MECYQTQQSLSSLTGSITLDAGTSKSRSIHPNALFETSDPYYRDQQYDLRPLSLSSDQLLCPQFLVSPDLMDSEHWNHGDLPCNLLRAYLPNPDLLQLAMAVSEESVVGRLYSTLSSGHLEGDQSEAPSR